ncbi:MAG: PilC/PilY family type IV pilus protein [Desulfobacterales bacterium]
MKRYLLAALLATALCAGALRADDTEIYGTVTNPDIEPNVLIIFDTSGSMATTDVPGDPYNPSATYTCGSCSYSSNAVYYRRYNYYTGQYWWDLFTGSINNINCGSIKTALLSQGYAEGYIYSTSFACGGSTYRRLRIGNYLNYIASGVGYSQSRISVAKQVLTDLIATTDNVRFGMMVFNPDQGGRLVAPLDSVNNSSHRTALLSAVAGATPSGWTPLAETLAEAGLYYAGMPSWFNTSGFPSGTYSGGKYVSPMQERCQKNYIIIMTDGEPTQDRDTRLWSGAYINGDTIAPYDAAEFAYPYDNGQNGSGYLDNVAKYLYEKDCNPAMGDGTSFDKQNIVTYTIGFKTQQTLLYNTAVNGGGEYFTAENYSELKESFSQIMSSIVEKNACYVAPVVPISRMNRVYAGDKIYLGFFKPQQSGRWIGNVKRYRLNDQGRLYDVFNQEATTPDGLIKDNAQSWWTSLGYDGPAVEKGGAAEVLNLLIDSGGARNVYTYAGSANKTLTHADNAFLSANELITNTLLGVDASQRQALFDTVRAGGFGDIIHSEPAVVAYLGPDNLPGTADDKTLIFVGANDGLLHCFDDDTGQELWSFVPPEHLGRLKRLNDADHDYFVDGSPVVFYGSGNQKILVVGARRGGESFTALDISNYTAPVYLYSLGPEILGPSPSSFERLGQSWSRPEKVVVATGSTVTADGCSVNIAVTTTNALLFGGGYDNNQDLLPPSPADSVGRAVFGVNTVTGALINGLKFSPATHPALGMTHSVVDVSGFDHDGDGIVSRVYFGDMGGNVFALKDDQMMTYSPCPPATIAKSVVDGSWAGIKLFNASADGVQRKIMYAPDAVAEKYPPGVHGEYIFFGTGDRENPGDRTVVNRFYAVKNDWSATGTLTESNLVDVTDNRIQLGTLTEQQAVRASLEAADGWFIRFENPGEKVVSSPRVYGGVVYFTTYTPSDDSGIDPSDPCVASTVRGVGRLYAVHYKTGAAVHDFSSEVETDTEGNLVALGKKDRALAVGTAIPSAPVIAILGGVARLFIGVEGGIVSLPVIATQDLHRYFWNQIF